MEGLVKRVGEEGGSTVLVKDRVGCRGSFMLHYLLRKLLSDTKARVVFLGLAEPFSHYSRIARKQGCNLQIWREKGRFAFVELNPVIFESSALRREQKRTDTLEATTATRVSSHAQNPLAALYSDIRDITKKMSMDGGEQICIMIDDASALDVATGGAQDAVLDFLHYCQALRCGNQRCSVVILTHEDIYEEPGDSYMSLELEFASDTVIKVEPLSTGLATDVHGQLSLLHREEFSLERPSQVTPVAKLQRFQFRILENNVQFFLPGQLC